MSHVCANGSIPEESAVLFEATAAAELVLLLFFFLFSVVVPGTTNPEKNLDLGIFKF